MIHADLLIEGASEVVTCAAPATASPAAAQSIVGSIPGGVVACGGERIVFVGTAEECRRTVALETSGNRIDARGGVVLPGFVDPHTHLPFGGWREAEFERRLAGASYQEIAAAGGGILSTVRATRALSPAELVRLARERLDAMLMAGTTTVEAKSGYGLSLESEIAILQALGLAASQHTVEVLRTCLGAHVVPPEYREGRRAEYVRVLTEELIPRVAREELARFFDVFVDEGAFTLDEARQILETSRRHGLGLRLHAEQLTRTGAAALGASLGAFSVDHLERLTEGDVAALAATWRTGDRTEAVSATEGEGAESRPPTGRAIGIRGANAQERASAARLAAQTNGSGPSEGAVPNAHPGAVGRRRGTVAILLPGAAFFLEETARPPVRALIAAGVPVALATDFNPGTSPCLTMPPILNLACLLFGMSPDEAIVAATRNAALSLGIEDRVGTLEAGKQADLVIWGVPDRRHLAYRFGPIPCEVVLKKGRIVAAGGRLVPGGKPHADEGRAPVAAAIVDHAGRRMSVAAAPADHDERCPVVAVAPVGHDDRRLPVGGALADQDGGRMLIDLAVKEFLDRLASEAPTPGGGSASALAGAQAAALLEMVIALTLKSEKYAASRPILEPMVSKANAFRTTLAALVDRDAQAYDGVVAANRMPKQTEQEKAARKAARENALMLAAEVPLETAEQSCAVGALAAEAAAHINPSAASDLLVAAVLSDAALAGAAANVRINLEGLKSEEVVARSRERLDSCGRRSAESLASIRQQLAGTA